MRYPKRIFLLLIILILVLPLSLALSNESIQAKKALDKTNQDIQKLSSLNIPIKRINETYIQADQYYQGQYALEITNRPSNYKLISQYISEMENIAAISIRANDELSVFKENWNKSQQNYNLTSIQSVYDEIDTSFQEERFEDTIKLIEQGYSTLSETESQQTSAKLFYASTSRSIKNFLEKNWKKILIILVIAIILIIIFWKELKTYTIKRKIEKLYIRKEALNNLIKKQQTDYFKTKKISDTEYKVKTERFKELIRDIDRQIPILKEDLAKINKKEFSQDIKKAKTKKRKK